MMLAMTCTGFYGWPYADVGGNADDRVSPRPDLVRKMITPDLLLDAHAAPLQFSFCEKQKFRQPIGKERLSLNMVPGTGVSGPGIRWYLFHSGMVCRPASR